MNSRFQKVTGHNNLVRDKQTGAILNTNKGEIAQSKRLKEAKRQESEKMANLSNEVTTLKGELSDIKSLLAQLVRNR